MKNILKICLISTTMFLVGCGCLMKSDEVYENIEHTLNQEEKRMLINIHHHYTIDMNEFYDLFRSIAKSRVVFGANNDKPASKDDLPFCDVIDKVKQFEDENKLEYSINSQWSDQYGITLIEACSGIGFNIDSVVNEDVPVKDTLNIVTVDNNELLSPSMYKEVRESVKDCNRAKTKVLDVTKDGGLLTVKDYDTIMKEVLKCEAFKLEKELQTL